MICYEMNYISIVSIISTCKRDDVDIFLEKALLNWTFKCLDHRREGWWGGNPCEEVVCAKFKNKNTQMFCGS